MKSINGKIFIACLALAAATLLGCGKKGPPVKVVFGEVTCGGEKVDCGQVAFVPIEGTPGTTHAVPIIDGKYRIDARGGVPTGKHRVVVDAKKKTGRKVEGFNGTEMGMIDETVRMGPEQYAGKKSPLIVEITSDGDGRFDIELPKQ